MYTCIYTYSLMPIGCLSIALDADMFSHKGNGPGTKAAGPRARIQQLLGIGPWSRARMHHG